MKTRGQADEQGQASRRRFTKSVATAIATAPLAVLVTKAQTPPAGKPTEAVAPPNPQPSPSPQQQQKPSPVAEAYAQVLRARFGDQFTPEQLEQIRKDLEGNVRIADRLRASKLDNGDEPDFTFIA
jgi:predicted pyridoxine 5'-phosphate oxidase superfamily flavin-nucleotide-binding protein